jgi:hypothetical protein
MDEKTLIFSLQIIASLQPGEKISTSSGVLKKELRPNPIKRWFNGDTRETTLTVIQHILEIAFVTLNPYIQELIGQVPSGLTNLKETYNTDEKICRQINILVERVKSYMY